MNAEIITDLIKQANDAREKSHSPYSSFAVGAALLCSDGKVYTGANIEVSSHSPTMCAERVAFARAVHEGRRDFTAIAVVGGPRGQDVDFLCPPCGVCRQVMSEFCSPDFKVILVTSPDGDYVEETLGSLMPYMFKL